MISTSSCLWIRNLGLVAFVCWSVRRTYDISVWPWKHSLLSLDFFFTFICYLLSCLVRLEAAFFLSSVSLWCSDSKCGFDHDCGFGRDREKSLKCRNRVSHCAENAVRPTQKPFKCGRLVPDRPHFESLLWWYINVSSACFSAARSELEAPGVFCRQPFNWGGASFKGGMIC